MSASNDNKRSAHFTFIWKVNCFPECTLIKSPEFSVQSMEMTKWLLRLQYNYGFLSCAISRVEENSGPESIEIEFELSLLDNYGSLLIKESDTKHFQKNGLYRLPLIPILEIADKICTEDALTVQCRIWRTRAEISKYELCFGSTHFDVHWFSCVWAIKEFSSLHQGEDRIRILNPSTKGGPQLILTLSLAERNDQECVFFHLESTHPTDEFYIKANISLLDAEGMVVQFNRAAIFAHDYRKSNELIYFEKSKLLSDAAVLLSDDVLLLRCELLFIGTSSAQSRIEEYKLMDYSDSKTVQTEKTETYFDELNEAAACPFKDMLNNFKEDGTLSDVCLRAGTKSFPVHKLILSSRSPVFKAMFTEDKKEKTSKCIDIPDVDEDTMNRLLLYIYENKIEDLTWEIAANLFEAADKYELLALKEKCCRFLKSNIFESNVCEILVLGDMHNDENLLKSAQEFILNNSEILYSDVWKAFRDDHSKLALETAEQIIYYVKHSKS